MRYIRFGDDSDVYAYNSVDGTLICCCCCMNEVKKFGINSIFKTLPELEDHLIEHYLRGDKVPKYAFENIEERP